MKSIRYCLLLLATAFLSLLAVSSDVSPQERYIEKYSAIAVSEMYRSGVPASITLAQGMLESRYGLSDLAAKGNNHFGIKCHNWTGKKQYNGNNRSECFRAYDSAAESFRDHSDFLRYQNRYKGLFEYKTTDYKSWAYGLKKAGYATDPAYPSKLIKIIEDYNLSRFDKMSVKDAEKTADKAVSKKEASVPDVKISSKAPNASKTAKLSKQSKSSRKEKKAGKAKKNAMVINDYIDDTQTVIPESPLSLEEPKKYTAAPNESFGFSLSRQMYSLNGVPFIYAAEGETLASIASSNNLFVKELLRFNDMKAGQRIEAGEIVYLQAKKKQTVKGLDKYIADHDGESLWEISQRYGVRLQELCKRNSLGSDYILREGDTILLR